MKGSGTKSLTSQLIFSCLLVVTFIGACLSLGRYVISRRDMEDQLHSTAQALTHSAAAFCLEPMIVEDFAVIETYAESFCARESELVGFTLFRNDGVVVVSVGEEENRPNDKNLTKRSPVRIHSNLAEPLGEVALTFTLEPHRERIKNQFIVDFALYGLIFAVLCLVVMALIRRGLARPLARLGQQAKSLGRSHLDDPIVMPEHRELIELAEAMEFMRKELRAKIDAHEQAVQAMASEVEIRRSAESSLRTALTEARTANDFKDAFLANTSHELRTPLAAILGFADTLKRNRAFPESGSKLLIGIDRNASHLLAVIEDVLDLSKITADVLPINMEPTNIPRILRDVERAARLTVAEGDTRVTLEMKTDAEWPLVETDGTRVSQIIRNLLDNAIKHTKSGDIHVRAHIDDAEAKDTTTLRIEVDDNGPGIPNEQIRSIFEPFQQLESADGTPSLGSGLGLTICQRLAQALGGTIEVSNLKPRGARFAFVVDLPVATPFGWSQTKESPTTYESGSLRILLVDDSEDMRDLTAFYLENDGGHKVTTAINGEEAIAKVGQAIDERNAYDCILMDVRMPVLDGYQAAARLRELECATPIVALTAHAMEGEKDRCLAAGYTDYLSKPIDFPRLLSLIQELNASCSDKRPTEETQ